MEQELSLSDLVMGRVRANEMVGRDAELETLRLIVNGMLEAEIGPWSLDPTRVRGITGNTPIHNQVITPGPLSERARHTRTTWEPFREDPQSVKRILDRLYQDFPHLSDAFPKVPRQTINILFHQTLTLILSQQDAIQPVLANLMLNRLGQRAQQMSMDLSVLDRLIDVIISVLKDVWSVEGRRDYPWTPAVEDAWRDLLTQAAGRIRNPSPPSVPYPLDS